MITVATFFSGTMKTVDAVISNFVHTAYMNFIQANAGIITLLFTFYVMVLGYQFLYHNTPLSLTTITRHCIVLSAVYGMVMRWDLYHLFVYNIFTNEPGNIAQVLVNSAEGSHAGQSIAQSLDGIYEDVVNAAINLFSQATFSFNGLLFVVYGVLVFFIGMLICIFSLLLFIYAKMMMAIALALGPVFILFILWNPTKGLFSAWLNKLITIALIPVVTSAILVLMLSVIDVTLPTLRLPAENQQFYGLAPFLGLALATTLVLSQVLRICSALGGGITLASITAGSAIVKETLQKTGLASLSQRAAYGFRGKMRAVKNYSRGVNYAE